MRVSAWMTLGTLVTGNLRSVVLGTWQHFGCVRCGCLPALHLASLPASSCRSSLIHPAHPHPLPVPAAKLTTSGGEPAGYKVTSHAPGLCHGHVAWSWCRQGGGGQRATCWLKPGDPAGQHFGTSRNGWCPVVIGERLVDAAANDGGSTVDHVTADGWPARGPGRDGRAGGRARAAAAVACRGSGCGLPAATVDAHAATPPMMTAAAASQTIPARSRITPALVPSAEVPLTGEVIKGIVRKPRSVAARRFR
jgi:hypothetical protein